MIRTLLLIVVICPYCLRCLEFVDRNESYNTPDISWLSKDSWGQNPISGDLVSRDHPNITGKVVFMHVEGGDWKNLEEVYKKGAKALVLFNTFFLVEGFLNYIKLNGIVANIPSHLPSVEISHQDSKKIKQLLRPVNGTYPSHRVTLFSDDHNPWRAINRGYVWFSVIIGGLCVVAIVLASRKIYKIKENRGLKASTSVICLSIHVLANSLRLVYVVIDPIYSRYIFPKFIHDLFAPGIPSLTLTTTVLVAFYWHETLYNAKKLKEMKHQRVDVFLTHAIIALSVIVIIDIGGAIVYAILDEAFLFFLTIALALMNIVSAIYLLVTGSFVLYRMSKIKQSNSTSMKIIRRITIQLMASAVLIILLPQFVYLTATPAFRNPNGFFWFFFVHFIFVMTISIVQITAIRIRHPDNCSSSKKNTLVGNDIVQMVSSATDNKSVHSHSIL